MNECMGENLDWPKMSHLFFSIPHKHMSSLRKSKPDPEVYDQITAVVLKQPDHSNVLIINMCLKVLRSSQRGAQNQNSRGSICSKQYQLHAIIYSLPLIIHILILKKSSSTNPSFADLLFCQGHGFVKNPFLANDVSMCG